ncbi:hypothetical protein AB0D04_30520 [Streptomyces sp. NPDC048483]|uniref:hypothetical protein n=1 Tax=Streptomyces sp. NPDC048483 TaxID=3154927 RepID=UPI0034463FBF
MPGHRQQVGDAEHFGREAVRVRQDPDPQRTRSGAGTRTVLAYRFEGDRWCTGQRFAAYRALIGDAFDGRVLPDSAANPAPPPFFADLVSTPHSVVTAHLVDEAGHPTVRARDEILAFLTDRLHPHGNRPPPAT